jgi:hypothetical protein
LEILFETFVLGGSELFCTVIIAMRLIEKANEQADECTSCESFANVFDDFNKEVP